MVLRRDDEETSLGVGPTHSVPAWQRHWPELMGGTTVNPAMHNHDLSTVPARMVHVGLSEKAPGYHLWRCSIITKRGTVTLEPYSPNKLAPTSKLRRGVCSFVHEFLVQVMYTNKMKTHNYCGDHAERHLDLLCTATDIEGCTGAAGEACAICRGEQR